MGGATTATSTKQSVGEEAIAQPKPKRKAQTCKSAEKAIKFYRARTWEHEYMLGETKSPTFYPERKKGACAYKKFVARKWVGNAKRNRKALDRLMQSNYGYARYIVYSTFPRSTAAAALSVVDCETGGTFDRWAHNSTTDVRGYFQVDSGNGGRVFHYRGETLTLDSSRLYDPWYNTRVALFMTSGGVNWGEWHCQPFVGIG